MPVPSGSLRKRRVTGDALQSSVRRSCVNLAAQPDYGEAITESPPIVVGIGHRSGYKSYTQTTPRHKNFVKKIARCGDSAKSIASVALKDDEILRYLSIGMGKLIK
uniref:Uncharacterized protein n=1 Tax=Amphimedon queenslandica TaxID=400682 RepID=A0A1X7U6L0_AMPQE